MLTAQEEMELIRLLEEEERERAKEDYELFAKTNIKIVNKNGESVSFVHNSIQRRINAKVKDLRDQGKPVRIIILKARQEGVSTNEQGRMIYNTTTKENRNALIVAHDDDATTAIFNKAKYMYDNLPEETRPLQKASNAKELIFDTPTHYKGDKKGLNSRIRVQIAGKTSIGRGDTYFYVHLSEFAFWPSPDGKEPVKQLAGILEAVPTHPESVVVIESTANGFNDFKALWDDAVAGNSDWVPMFFAWHDYEEYKMPVTEDERIEIMQSLTEYEQKIVNLYNLTAEQLKWYRWKLANTHKGDLNMMRQENPSYPEEAFIFSGTPIFDNDKIMHRIEVLRKADRKVTHGYFEFDWNNPEHKDFIKDDTIKFVETSPDDKRGIIRIYEQPKIGYPYVIGGDTKGEGRDSYAGQVINNVTGNRAATLKMDVNNSKPYTWQMYCLGHYYNLALISIEINFNTAPIEELERLHYPRLYQREKYDDFTGTYKKAYGWKTDGTTRPLIIDKEVHLTNENLGLFNDIETLQQMLTFVRDRNGRPDAMPGKHDDLLLADMIGEESRGQQCRIVEEQTKDIDDDEEETHNDDNWFN